GQRPGRTPRVSERDTAGVIAPPPLIALGALAGAAALEWIAPIGWAANVPAVVRTVFGIVLIAAGVLLISAAISGFMRAGTAVRTHEPSTTLVTTGVYAALRNPIYVGFFLILIGIASLAAWDWLVIFAFVFVAIIHWGVVRREERYLSAKF